ncbi:MAG: type III-B CRISPR-associated protein Cas10/Cmr2 [Gammaproteobacteria bacterium]
MSHTLLLVAIGPVQQFIGQARRMRDLWFGSHLLSEMSRAAARSLATSGWTLIFPALNAGDPELAPCDGTVREDEHRNPPLGIANKVVAIREDADDPMSEDAARSARRAAVEVWERLAGQARKNAGKLLAADLREHELPEAVVESFLEFIAGWSAYEAEGDFENARSEAEQAVAARKSLRDFRQWQGGTFRKSSLDGQRESILTDRKHRESHKRPAGEAAKLRLREREHLDGIGFVKRAAGHPEQFVPIARVAVEPWLQALDEAAKQSRRLFDAFKTLEEECQRQQVPYTQRGVTRWLQGAFPYDGEIFFEGQWPALDKELGLKEFGKAYVKPLFRKRLSLPEPHPYVACLCADGDRMGAALGSLRTPDLQRKLSASLAGFSKGVRDIVEDHHGLHIYAGGDDVVAFLPAVYAVPCAEALREAFMKAVRPAFLGMQDERGEPPPTLSIGVGIGHFLTPLGQLLHFAREAEKYAKQGDRLPEGDPGQRNALSVIVDKRSGDRIRWRAQWDRGPRPGERLARIKKYFVERRMPTKLPYELKRILVALEDAKDDDRTARAWRHEVARIVARKRSEANTEGLTLADIDLDLPSPEDAEVNTLREKLREWVGAAMVARALADAERNAEAVKARGKDLEMQDGD